MTTTEATTIDAPPNSAPRYHWLRAALFAFAIYELLDSLTSVALLFSDDAGDFFSSVGGRIIQATIALRPLAALAVLVLAAMGRTRQAIMAMAVIVLLAWLSAMPSVVAHKPEFDNLLTGLQTVFQVVARPLLAVMAIAMAKRNERLALATAMVCLPTLVSIIEIAAFAIGVAIYGF